jgi:hypothetical protein
MYDLMTAAASGEYPSVRGSRVVGRKKSDETEEIPRAQKLMIGML